MDCTYAKFHQILTTLLVDPYYGALHTSLQDWVLKTSETHVYMTRTMCTPQVLLYQDRTGRGLNYTGLLE